MICCSKAIVSSAPSPRSALRFAARAVVLTTGTFLSGLIHVGLQNYQGGRAGDPPAVGLARRLRELKLPVGRLKTGTPPRHRRAHHRFFADRPNSRATCRRRYSRSSAARRSIRAAFRAGSRTPTRRTHEIIRGGLDRSPMFTGVIEGRGPALLPVDRRQDPSLRRTRVSHQIFLEPEGLTVNEFYPNGISTSLPFDVQYALVRSIRGLENAHITRPGYAIEYDYLDPRALEEFARIESDRRVCSSPARSTARPGTKRRPRRACLPGQCGAAVRRGAKAWCPHARPGLSRRARGRSDHARRLRAVSHVHQPRRVSAFAARRQRRPAADRNRPQTGARGRCALERLQRKARSDRARAGAPEVDLGQPAHRGAEDERRASSVSRSSANTRSRICCGGRTSPTRR